AIRSGQLSQKKAEAEFKISRATIKNKLKNRFLKKPGHPTIFTNDEEKDFGSHIKFERTRLSWYSNGKNKTALPKDQFPALLKKALDNLQPTKSHNVISGFRAAGIVLINVEELLSNLFRQDREMNVAVGQSICLDDIEEANNSYVLETEQQPIREKGRSKRSSSQESSSEKNFNHSMASSLESNESFGSL
ncbi:hypothetical protein ILUMI_18633, partial [Ignelater luminosus]